MNIKTGVALESFSGATSSLAFPSVCVLPMGRWLVSCRAAPQKIPTRGQHVLLVHSDDEGRSWSTPAAPFAPLEIQGRAGLFRTAALTSLGDNEVLAAVCWVDHSDPAADFFNEQTQGLLDTRIFLARSHDGGHSWSTPQLVDTAPFHVPTPLTGPILRLPNGEWLMQFELNKSYDDVTEWHHSSIVMLSRDEGASWPEYSVASNDPDNRIFYWDQRPSVLSDGTLLNLFWTYDNVAAKYLNIHARRSQDGGRSWSKLWNCGVPGQPAPPVSLPDGRIALVYMDREAEPILKLRLSEDDGQTWPAHSEKILFRLGGKGQTKTKGSMQDAWEEMGRFSLGLPTTCVLPDGDLLVVFYAGTHTDRTDIHWLRVRF
jgi:hypothetical protein